MLLQMALFHSFLWLSSSPLYIYIVEKGMTEGERDMSLRKLWELVMDREA